MTVYDMHETLAMERGVMRGSVINTLKSLIPGCTSVTRSTGTEDRSGVDWWAMLRGGHKVGVDGKTRREGCSCFWNGEPELALELWSVVEKRKTGWTLDESKTTEYVFYYWPPSDTRLVFLIPFQLLRKAFRENLTTWFRDHKSDVQKSRMGDLRWHSQAVFVPASVVMCAVDCAARGELLFDSEST